MNKDNKKIKEFWRFVKYWLIAGSAALIEFGVETFMKNVCKLDGEYWWISYTTGLVLSVIWNFTINRKYTFKSANNIPIAMLKVALYYVVFTPLSLFFGDWLVTKVGWNGDLVTVINILINGITEFLYQRYFVFGKSIDTNELAKKENKEEVENE